MAAIGWRLYAAAPVFLAGLWAGAALMFGLGTWCWPADHPGRTWVTLPRPAEVAGPGLGVGPGELIPRQQLPTRPVVE